MLITNTRVSRRNHVLSLIFHHAVLATSREEKQTSDWMFEAGYEPLPVTMPDQPWLPNQGPAVWFEGEATDDPARLLLDTQPKGGLGDFGPIFNGAQAGAENEDPTDLGEVVVIGDRIVRFPTAVQVTIGDVSEPPTNGGGGGGSGASGPNTAGLNGHESVDCATNDIKKTLIQSQQMTVPNMLELYFAVRMENITRALDLQALPAKLIISNLDNG